MIPTFENEEEENAFYRKEAGECVKCVNYQYDDAIFGDDCSECSRFYGDHFEEKETK